MKKKIHFFIVTIVLLATLFALSIGAQLQQEVGTLSTMTKESAEEHTRLEIRSILSVARETVVQYVELENLDVTKDEVVESIVQRTIKPLNIDAPATNVILLQIEPEMKVIYKKSDFNPLSEDVMKLIKTGIDSRLEDNVIYDTSNNNKIIEWVGIPPGIQAFDEGNVKWVLIIEKDSSALSKSTQSIINLQTGILYRLYLILFISCLVVITTVITIYQLQTKNLFCENKPNCDKLHKA